jgi:FkbM family methyltransferase
MTYEGLTSQICQNKLGFHSWNSDDDQQSAIPDAKIIFDVGANVGQTAKTYRRLYPSSQIWSFEPFPSTYESLRNSLSDPQFHPMPLALSNEVGKATLHIGAESITNSFMERASDTGKTIDVQTDTVDHFCSEHRIDKIDILKVDVEGAEIRVFKGAQEMFSREAIQAVFVEVYFDPIYEGMPLMWDLHSHLLERGFFLHGLYSLFRGRNRRLSFGNALYLRQ